MKVFVGWLTEISGTGIFTFSAGKDFVFLTRPDRPKGLVLELGRAYKVGFEPTEGSVFTTLLFVAEMTGEVIWSDPKRIVK